jgi:hypothetical protein
LSEGQFSSFSLCMVRHAYVFELDVQLCDIFLEKLNSASRRIEDIKRFHTTRY